jgi:hypothetical protein
VVRPARRTSKLLVIAEDHPGRVNLVLTCLVAAQAFVAHFWLHGLSPGRALTRSASVGNASVLFLGGATVAAMVAGFAGVVVVFALSSTSDRVQVFRRAGGRRLLSNWTSPVSVAFLAAALSLAASYLCLVHARGWAWWFELSLLYLTHGAVRLLWLLRTLARIVASDDKGDAELRSRAPVESVILNDGDA